MITEELKSFCDRMLVKGSITPEDVRELAGTVLPDGPLTREDADTLIALDRAVPESCLLWADHLVANAVWTARPTGHVEAEAARWLADSLGCGNGPSATGARIAFEIVREAHRCDESLVAFALEANGRARDLSGAAAFRAAA